MRRVTIESPFAGDIEANLEYARACLRDSLERGEAPFASHLLYTQVLDDGDSVLRKRGMEAGFAYSAVADAIVVYVDRGVSPGMNEGIERARAFGVPVEFRSLRQS